MMHFFVESDENKSNLNNETYFRVYEWMDRFTTVSTTADKTAITIFIHKYTKYIHAFLGTKPIKSESYFFNPTKIIMFISLDFWCKYFVRSPVFCFQIFISVFRQFVRYVFASIYHLFCEVTRLTIIVGYWSVKFECAYRLWIYA